MNKLDLEIYIFKISVSMAEKWSKKKAPNNILVDISRWSALQCTWVK